jgi:hypothetical protein
VIPTGPDAVDDRVLGFEAREIRSAPGERHVNLPAAGPKSAGEVRELALSPTATHAGDAVQHFHA